MTFTIIGYLSLFVYFSIVAGVLRQLIKKGKGLPLGNLVGKHQQMTVMLCLPTLLMIPLGHSLWDLTLIQKSMDLPLSLALGKLAGMMGTHFAFVLFGSVLLLFADNVFYNGLEDDNEDDDGSKSMLIGMIILAVAFAGICFYPMQEALDSFIPQLGIKGFN